MSLYAVQCTNATAKPSQIFAKPRSASSGTACKVRWDYVRRPVRSTGGPAPKGVRSSAGEFAWAGHRERRSSKQEATWRSGDAADCKSAYPGSIPGVASNTRACFHVSPKVQPWAPKKIELSPRQRRSVLLCGAPSGPLPVFRGSSVVERPTVNRMVVGSNPTRGAKPLLLSASGREFWRHPTIGWRGLATPPRPSEIRAAFAVVLGLY